MLRIQSKAIRTILRWQIIGTVIAAAGGAAAFGFDCAMSIALGGGIGIVAALAFDFASGRRDRNSLDASAVVFRALRAEAVKIGVMLVSVLAVLFIYKEVMKLPFIAAFIVSMLSLSAAFFVREE